MDNLSIHFRYEVAGGHTHVAIFAGKDADHRAKCGDVTFRNEEWERLELWLEGASNDMVDVQITVRQEGTDHSIWPSEEQRPAVERVVVEQIDASQIIAGVWPPPGDVSWESDEAPD